MKYIRTKDGVYEATDWNEDGSCWCLNDGGTYFRKENIIAKADTIKELCDCLMFVDNDKQKDFLITDVNEDNMNCYDNKKETCYGCIKIELSNGAIRIEPIAKLNENGELELI